MIERTFNNIPKGELRKADQQSFLIGLGWSRGTVWDDLLRSKRVLIISEAGAGKTYECRNQAKCLWDAGEPSFFIELAALASGDLRDALDSDEEARLDEWLVAQSDVATFFLDSIDELKLTRSSFELALKRFKKGIGSQLSRARIIITSRPVPFDEQLVRRVLPIPPRPSAIPKEEAFVKNAMGSRFRQQSWIEKEATTPDWRTVALMPLSDAQIEEFAYAQGIKDSAELMDDLRNRNAQEFARRPQDLIELCADWRDHKRIRMHRDQVESNVHLKLKAREGRPELAELSVNKAVDGASRLALAMQVMRLFTIRHSAESDDINDEGALDPSRILSDWKPNERKALLERSLFGFASYGRVRFHHRSVAEYLAAKHIDFLRSRGMPFRALIRLIFAQTKGKTIVRPSLRPVAGWLALTNDRIFEMLRDNEPAVLLDEGDPEALSQSQRNQALRAYVGRYSEGGWRGLSVPHIQIHRFASPELADEVKQLWDVGIENPEVRQTMLSLIEAGRIGDCTDIAYSVALDAEVSAVERMIAIDAMVALADPRLQGIAVEMSAGDSKWPDTITRGMVLRLFPQNLSIAQLCTTLSWVKERESGTGELGWQLHRLIANAKLDRSDLEALRDGLIKLISEGLYWRVEYMPFVCNRSHLSGALSATCVRGLAEEINEGWLSASVLALRLHDRQYSYGDAHTLLREQLADLPASHNKELFWAEDALLKSLRVFPDPWSRFVQITMHDGPVKLLAERDLIWIKKALGNTNRDTNDRAMLLEAAMSLCPNQEKYRNLAKLVADQPDLLVVIDERLKPSEHDKIRERLDRKQAVLKAQREQQEAKKRESWIKFWREVNENPESVFSTERSGGTAWSLWQVMSQDGGDSHASGWNRRFIEDQFGKGTADRLRRVLMGIWRKDHPALESERPEDQRNTYLVRWQLGLAALYAEAEDPEWAAKLNHKEAQLATRYAPIDLNGLPRWMESLVIAHPNSVDATLGKELDWELEKSASEQGHSMLLQSISSAPSSVAKAFLPRFRAWLDANGDNPSDQNNLTGNTELLRKVIGALLKHGNEDARTYLLAMARQRLVGDLPNELAFVWLPTLMRINSDFGISALEDRIRAVEPAARSEAVTWFSLLFWDRRDAVSLTAFSPQLLLRLLRLAYRHVRVEDDVVHEDSWRPDTRDDAESARNHILSTLLDSKGEEGWAAKLEMASDPVYAHFKERIISVAEESWAQEIDSQTFDETQAIALDQSGEAPATTNDAMFTILKDRLADLDDLLLSDVSPRDAWAGFKEEKIMRREIARELQHAANGIYKVDQEAVTADEKETDIRLLSVVSSHEAVIELKLADGRSARDLLDTISDQLVKKYMAPEKRRSGCLLVTLAKDRTWQHPESRAKLDLVELESLLHDEAKRIEKTMGGAVALVVHILDLRPRLPIEKVRRASTKVR